ncbi:hypothetical protein HC928_11240 [bacterium]|nr:hypothetical protein [bacterium]
MNSPAGFILMLVEVDQVQARLPRSVINCPFHEPNPLASSVNFDLRELVSMSEEPT